MNQKKSRKDRRAMRADRGPPVIPNPFLLGLLPIEEFTPTKSYLNSAEFEEEEFKFRQWLNRVVQEGTTKLFVRATKEIHWKKRESKEKDNRRRSEQVLSKDLKTRQFNISLEDVNKLKSPLKALYVAMLYGADSDLDVEKLDAYADDLDDEESSLHRTFIIKNLTIGVISANANADGFDILAKGIKHKKGKDTCKSNIPMFESVKFFARINQCSCQPGKQGTNCSNFLICPFEFQHPIQSISDLTCQNLYSCVGLALSIVLFQAATDSSNSFQIRMKKEHMSMLRSHLANNTLSEDRHQGVIQQKQIYSAAIEDLMGWTSSHNIESYGIDVVSGAAIANQFMESKKLQTYLAFFDLFKETIEVIKNIEKAPSRDAQTITKIVKKRLDALASNNEGIKTFYLVYYLSHVLVMHASNAQQMLVVFTQKFIEVRMKPYKLMPNNSPMSFYTLHTCVQPAKYKEVIDAQHIPFQAATWFDAFQPAKPRNVLLCQDFELMRSLAIVDGPDAASQIQYVTNQRTKTFNLMGLAAFDIETCKETDQDLLKCGDGNQIPYMLSLKGRLYNYHTQSIVWVEKMFVQTSDFDDVWNSVPHLFVKYLIDGNFFSTQDEPTKNYIFAHNGSKFDFLFILRWLSMYTDKTKFNIIGSPDHMKAIICSGLAFYDSFLLISKSLNQMSLDFLQRQKHQGVDIGEINKDDLVSLEFNISTSDQPSRFDRVSKYCMQDSVLLYECMNKFLLTQFIDPLKVTTNNHTSYVFSQKPLHMTASSMSISLFASAFLKYPVGCVQKALPYERQTYSGGFTCNFRTMSSFGFSFDINSAYPAQMLGDVPLIHEHEGACQPIQQTINGQTTITSSFKDTDLFKVSYQFELDEETALIMRTDCRTALIELNVLDNVWMWGIQLNHMIEILQTQPQKSFVTIHTAIKYEARPIYKEYIQTIYKARQENKENPVLNAMYKMLMCGLYGKHGQKDMKSNQMFSSIQDAIDYVSIAKCYLNRFKGDADQKPNMWLYVVRQMKDAQIQDSNIKFIQTQQPVIYGVELLEPSQQHIGSLVRMASYVSAKNRVYLINSYRQVVKQLADQCDVDYGTMRKLFQLVYCDTDSLYIDAHMLIAKLIENQSDTHTDARLLEYINQCNRNEFIVHTRQLSTTEEGLLQLRQLFAYVVEKSNIVQMLDKTFVSDPEAQSKQIPFLDQSRLGSFKIEKNILVGAFAAPKQYSVYYFEEGDYKIKNDVKLKGVRQDSRLQQPQLIFEQVDMVRELLITANHLGFESLNERLLTKEEVILLVDSFERTDTSYIDKVTLKFSDLVQFRGHKTGVSIYKLVKYISFVLSKRVITLDVNAQCVSSKPHTNNSSFLTQRNNLLAITKTLRKRKIALNNTKRELLSVCEQTATCVYAIKNDNAVKRDFQRMVDEHSNNQAFWFYEQTLMQNSCTSLLDKIGNSKNNLFSYVRSNTPVNFKLVQTFMELVKCKSQLSEAFMKAMEDYEMIKEYIDEETIMKAYKNNLLRDFVNPGTDESTLISIYAVLMLLNTCIAKWVWHNEQTKNSTAVDEVLDRFTSFFKQQKNKDIRKKAMTESIISYNQGVVFQVSMFQYTCKVVSQAMALDVYEDKDKLRLLRIRNAWNYDNDINSQRQYLSDKKIDLFLGMAPTVTINDYESDDFEID